MQANKSRDLVEANIVVYSVTDRASFQYAQSCLQELRPAKRHNVVILVANKQDIVRNRVISEQGQSASLYLSRSVICGRQTEAVPVDEQTDEVTQ